MSKLSGKLVPFSDYKEEAEKLWKNYGSTNRHKTGVESFDEWLYGGFGRPSGYEIVVVHGPTGVGKTTLATQMLMAEIVKGTKIGLMVLEDYPADLLNKIRATAGEEIYKKVISQDNVHLMPPKNIDRRWKLDELRDLMEEWYKYGDEIILIDPLQFAFENAKLESNNIYDEHRDFLTKVNFLVKEMQKTAIIISHDSKDKTAKGKDKIIGSSGIAQIATKIIEIDPDKNCLWMNKSRFTPTRDTPISYSITENGIFFGNMEILENG